MLAQVGKFVDSAVRPVVTLGLAATVVYMAVVQGQPEATTVVTTTAVLVIGFWFKDRNADKAADAALKGTNEAPRS